MMWCKHTTCETLVPVTSSWPTTIVFSPVSDGYAQLYGSDSLWVDEFQMIELDEVMRQRGDRPFSELFCRVRTNSCTHADIDI